jgi:hypothetical protein
MTESIKAQFTDEEWFEISSMPTMVGAAMAGAGKSGVIGTAKEAMASMKAIVAARNDYPDNQLIAAILEKAESFSDARERAGDYREMAVSKMKEQNVTSPEEFNRFMFDHCDRAIALVAGKCSARETDEYRQWAKDVAARVAEAASEGGFLGFGGERVSEPERQLLAQIEQRLSSAIT